MTVNLIRMLSDFGLVVLIWMVQLIIYPSFARYTHENLLSWHRIYTKRLASIVIPLMFTQAFVVAYQLYKTQEFFTYCSAVLVVLVWLSTFTQFVPLHNNISKGEKVADSVEKLIQRNWIRTALWTLLFMLSLWNNILK
ncbi:hypothetical protein EJ994_05450 [Maribacter sp. MJ134]|uniref:hypothetical protein n=1 Tax=Maribacter sp. MJ134 TaxID=2496865 RepID=UPI000F832245|nr:hypothetical protein [Maribacter sp. MJ134]AZQ58280.1 hypothetical protein EJ994_05450 [Maribacter sp. MJ134]